MRIHAAVASGHCNEFGWVSLLPAGRISLCYTTLTSTNDPDGGTVPGSGVHFTFDQTILDEKTSGLAGICDCR